MQQSLHLYRYMIVHVPNMYNIYILLLLYLLLLINYYYYYYYNFIIIIMNVDDGIGAI
jgi:hypothetical protein